MRLACPEARYGSAEPSAVKQWPCDLLSAKRDRSKISQSQCPEYLQPQVPAGRMRPPLSGSSLGVGAWAVNKGMAPGSEGQGIRADHLLPKRQLLRSDASVRHLLLQGAGKRRLEDL